MQRLGWLLGIILLIGCTSRRAEKVEPVSVVPPASYLARPELPSRPVAAPLIVLDAGHGGHDDGARCLAPPYPEKRATLQLTQLLQKRLTALGYRVALTRCQDVFLSLHERALLANQRGAAAFISLHFNHCNNPSAKGIEVFYFSHDPWLKRDLLSKQLADSVLKHCLENTFGKDRGVKEANFVVIRTTQMPSVLVEGGFLSNLEEGRQISDIHYLERLAQGIALGIHHYFVHNNDADAPLSVFSEVAGRRPGSPLAKAKKVSRAGVEKSVASQATKAVSGGAVSVKTAKAGKKGPAAKQSRAAAIRS
jgi:N-acetylmuramoyl-L-alanine amidase